MRLSHTVIIPFLILFVFTSISTAQLVKVGVGGGITQVTGPKSITDDVSEAGLGFSTEWNLGLVGKVDLPLIPITPRGYFLYHSFSGSGDIMILEKAAADNNVEYSQSVLEIGVGAQYNFIPAPLGFDPYLALDISFNSFGDFKTNYFGSETKEAGFTRFGGGIGIGTEISIVPVVNLDLYLSYKMLNLIGKEDGEETISAVTLDAFIIFNFL